MKANEIRYECNYCGKEHIYINDIQFDEWKCEDCGGEIGTMDDYDSKIDKAYEECGFNNIDMILENKRTRK